MEALTDSFDYVIVGSGAGGGPLAARLAAAGHSVCVLEAGGAEEPISYQVPSFHGLATEEPDMRWDFFVRHYDDPDQQRRDTKFVDDAGGVLYPRAGTLGGCTAHNAMLTVYPHDRDWDDMAAIAEDESFNSETMRKHFERLEGCTYVDPPRPLPRNRLAARIVQRLPLLRGVYENASRHGYEGWLCTTLADPKLALGDKQLVDVVVSATKETLQQGLGRALAGFEDLESLLDPNDWRVRGSREGLWLAPLAVRNGGRVSARDVLLAAARQHPDRLEIRTGALASRVLFDEERRAVGVEYLQGRHLYRADPRAIGTQSPAEPRTVRAEREVVLAAGAFNTPQLLKLSGVGPREELERHGVEVLVDRPGVGENLQDRYEVGVICEMKGDFPLLEGASFRPPQAGDPPDPALDQWRVGEGLYTSNGVVVGVIRASSVARPDPDLFIFGLPAKFQGYYPGYAGDLTRDKRHFTWAILKAHTRNRAGTVRLRSDDPRDVPDINFRYFDDGGEEDLEAMADGVEFVRQVMSGSREYIEGEVLPGDAVATRDQIKAFVRDQAWGHHASCTCAMGPARDERAVVDGAFRVHGTQALRIVDASVFPRIPGFFIVTSVYMISEKAARAMLADAQKGPVREAIAASKTALRRIRQRVAGRTARP
ncbi:MAG: GMC family oxidoreductase N-terminal domain-containing protein [Actinomycetota bacterium]|nr:GMC family oxidoreductase N-terminal domain-containing protein [Actinomycetota bacterium]